jgi:hypothetical protein
VREWMGTCARIHYDARQAAAVSAVKRSDDVPFLSAQLHMHSSTRARICPRSDVRLFFLGGYSRQNGVSALRAFRTGWVHLVHEAVWILSLTHAGGKEVIYVEVSYRRSCTGCLMLHCFLEETIEESWGLQIQMKPIHLVSKEDLKILHVDNKVVDSVIEQVDGEYGKEVPIKVT